MAEVSDVILANDDSKCEEGAWRKARNFEIKKEEPTLRIVEIREQRLILVFN